MNDEWRVQVDLAGEAEVLSLSERLQARNLQHQLSGAFSDRVIVSRDGARLFLYAGDRKQAEAAMGLVDELTTEHGWRARRELTRWHPERLEWEDPDEPLEVVAGPEDAARTARVAAERETLEQEGKPEFEVRVDLPSRHEAERFAELLRAEGLPAVRRWSYLVVGAPDEDAARALAARLEGEAPGQSTVTAEGSGRVAWAERPPNPFSIFGGLGG